MKKGKRLLITLLATLTMVASAFGVAYAEASDYYISGLRSYDDGTVTILSVNDDHPMVGTVYMHPNTDSENFVYDGTPKEVWFTASAMSGYQIGDPISGVFQCYRTGQGNIGEVYTQREGQPIRYEGTTAAGNAYSSTTAPTDAGEYTATAKLYAQNNGPGGWIGPETITTTFTIKPKPIDVEWVDNSGTDPEAEFTYNYDGENHVPDAKIPSGLASGDKVSVNVTGSAKTVATHTATAKLVGPDAANYVPSDETKTQEFTIAPKPITVTWAGDGGSSTDFDFTYNAKEQGPTCTIDANQIIKGETCTVTVTGQETNVGDYTATATLSNDNYVIIEQEGDNPNSSTHEFSILQKDVSFKWKPTYDTSVEPPKNPEFIYNGAEQCPEATDIQGLIDGDDCSLEVSGQETEKGTNYEATAELTGASKDNYNLTTNPVQRFDIVANTVVTLTWSPASFVYNAEYQCPEAEVTTEGKMEEGDCKLIYTVHKGTATGEEVPEGEKMSVGTYVVTAELEDTNNFEFDDETEREFEFKITRCPITAELSIASKITYDGKFHYPTPTLNTIYDVDKDKVKPIGIIIGTPLNGKEEVVLLDNDDFTAPEVFPDKDHIKKGVTHASSGNYDAQLVGIYGEEAHNYKLQKAVTTQFEISPRPVTLDWFRPAYDAYGDKTGGKPVKVDVAGGEKLKLVFNGKVQAPAAEVKANMLLVNEDKEEKDTCKVTVSGPSNAIEASDDPYKVTDIAFSNPDYTRDKTGADFYIVAHPVKLAWDKTVTTYNGKVQKRTVKITNIQKTKRGKDYSAGEGIGVVKVSKITYTKGAHFGTAGKDTDESKSTFNGKTGYYKDDGSEEKGLAEGSKIAGGRTPTDAGTYVMTAAELSDPFNYTLVRIDPESVELDPAVIPEVEQPAYVANHHPIYKIHQYEIKKIDWRNTNVTYNASNQKPIAEVNKSNLQGPDTNKEVAVMIHDDKNSTKDNFAGKCNAKTYTINVLKNDTLRGIKGARCMNYFIGKSAKAMQTKFTIGKKLLTVTVYNKTGYYGDNPATYKHTVKYTGLINGKVNKDDNHQKKNIPGKYNPKAPAAGTLKKVVEGTPKYTTVYKKWGKPGVYSVKASGLKSDNYKIKYVAGKLTIKNRLLPGDFLAKAKAGNKKLTITWNQVYGAAKYQIYFSHCNTEERDYEPKLYKTVGAKTKSFVINNLEWEEYYKFYMVALDKNGKPIAKTYQHHSCTNDVYEEYTNPKAVKASKTKVTLNKGKTYKLSANVSKVVPWKTLTNGTHTQKLRYKSGNKNVATVTANGTIKGVSTGWCRVYVMGANGIWQAVEVTVK